MTITFDTNIFEGVDEKDEFTARFIVTDSEERSTEKSGKFILLRIEACNDITQKTYKVNQCLFFNKKSAWKLKEFFLSVGKSVSVLVNGKIDKSYFINMKGKVALIRGASGYMEIKKFLPKNEIVALNKDNTSDKDSCNNACVDDDSIPF